ncbi:hypothetical protein AaE_000448 [Aphanomyces astaci]|uniref:Uncharacterized protein n=1 Tax=Aphanomyces astaci TaxID=112090 RepID=A0A6A5AZU4_APHAT|nr:hypothetical protein AaE_000448 [Aphanomyces astaci]
MSPRVLSQVHWSVDRRARSQPSVRPAHVSVGQLPGGDRVGARARAGVVGHGALVCRTGASVASGHGGELPPVPLHQPPHRNQRYFVATCHEARVYVVQDGDVYGVREPVAPKADVSRVSGGADVVGHGRVICALGQGEVELPAMPPLWHLYRAPVGLCVYDVSILLEDMGLEVAPLS